MDTLLNDSVQYFSTIFNQLDKIQQISNYGIVQMVSKLRKYQKGKINQDDGLIYGKPDGLNTEFDLLFKKCISDINNDINPIIEGLKKYDKIYKDDAVMREIKKNMISYINSLSSTFPNEIQIPIQEMVNVQTNLIQTIRKINLVCEKTDGKILNTGTAAVYNLSGTSETSIGSAINTYNELTDDYKRFYDSSGEYIRILNDNEIINVKNISNKPSYYTSLVNEVFGVNVNQVAFFMVMARILTNQNKKQTFISSVVKGPLKDVKKLTKIFTDIIDDMSKEYEKELNAEEKKFNKFKNSKTYNNYIENIEQTLYTKGKTRKFDYSTVQPTLQQEKKIINLYKTVNIDSDDNFTNKITLN